MFGPDETASNRLDALFEVTGRTWMGATHPDDDEHLSPDGRVTEVLSEHLCQGMLEGYLLTGRHGLFSCYEAFIHIVDSMFNQHAKWLKTTRHLAWRRPLASLNILLTSHVWRQDHNGLSHQDPGFIDHVVNKKADTIRVYLPPDANCLLSVADHCLRSRHYVNVIVAGKQPALQYLSIDEAVVHCTKGLGIWEWASTDKDGEPDVVLACAGDVPTLEVLAAADLLRQHCPDLKVRVVNVVDLMTLQPDTEHPHGISDAEFDSLFTTDKPVIFAYHGYPWLIHRLTYRRHNHDNLHVRGYKEEGTTTTPFEMTAYERHGPLPPGHRRHRPGPGPRTLGRPPPPGDDRPSHPPPPVHPRITGKTRRRCATGRGRTDMRACWSSTPVRRASSCGSSTRAIEWWPARIWDRPMTGLADHLRDFVGRLSDPVDVIGHRVVHGGRHFTGSDGGGRGTSGPAWTGSTTWRRCTIRSPWPPSTPPRPCSRTSRPWPASIPPSTPVWSRPPSPTPFPTTG